MGSIGGYMPVSTLAKAWLCSLWNDMERRDGQVLVALLLHIKRMMAASSDLERSVQLITKQTGTAVSVIDP